MGVKSGSVIKNNCVLHIAIFPAALQTGFDSIWSLEGFVFYLKLNTKLGLKGLTIEFLTV